MNPFGCPEVLFSPGIVIGAGKPLQTNPVLDPKERNDKNDRPLESHKNRTLLGGMRWYCLASSFLAAKQPTDPVSWARMAEMTRMTRMTSLSLARKNKNK